MQQGIRSSNMEYCVQLDPTSEVNSEKSKVLSIKISDKKLHETISIHRNTNYQQTNVNIRQFEAPTDIDLNA